MPARAIRIHPLHGHAGTSGAWIVDDADERTYVSTIAEATRIACHRAVYNRRFLGAATVVLVRSASSGWRSVLRLEGDDEVVPA